MDRTIRSFSLTMFAVSLSAAAGAEVLQLDSGPEQVGVIELYTSEGCSSCPPADRWLSGLEDHPGLWSKFVPVAFHVDYWDYIGWSDRYARPEYGERQERYAGQGGARYVYTPGVFVNGREWHGWRSGRRFDSSVDKPGILRAELVDERVLVQFDAADTVAAAGTAHVALLGMNLETRVRAGENAGRILVHDFVVLGTASAPLNEAGGALEAELPLPQTGVPEGRRAIVVWVEAAASQVPRQAVGAFLSGH